jgi:hypothetical protein
LLPLELGKRLVHSDESEGRRLAHDNGTGPRSHAADGASRPKPHGRPKPRKGTRSIDVSSRSAMRIC